MTILIEVLVLCLMFTGMVFIMLKDPIKTVYNYPPKIQERVKSLDMYKGKIPSTKNMLVTKGVASIFMLIIIALVLRYVNGCTSFLAAFGTGYLLWTIVNIYDALVIDCLWFCHSKKCILPGTEDMVKEYKDYFFHIKESLIGEVLGLVVCALAALIVAFIL